jgi:5-(aminomethyl)-3-furanmethanol phosphate kinase
MEPFVVKLGGSLMDRLPVLIPLLTGQKRPLLIVPGGGRFAQIVRDCGLTGDAAHWMAIAAMDEFGWYISSFGISVADALFRPKNTRILLPYGIMRVTDPLPHRWDVTSDTIAAWVAHCLGLPLVVLKSVDGITSGGELLPRVAAPIPCDEVDPFFIPYVLSHGVPSVIVNGQIPERVISVLDGRPTRGTLISTTL